MKIFNIQNTFCLEQPLHKHIWKIFLWHPSDFCLAQFHPSHVARCPTQLFQQKDIHFLRWNGLQEVEKLSWLNKAPFLNEPPSSSSPTSSLWWLGHKVMTSSLFQSLAEALEPQPALYQLPVWSASHKGTTCSPSKLQPSSSSSSSIWLLSSSPSLAHC